MLSYICDLFESSYLISNNSKQPIIFVAAKFIYSFLILFEG